MTFDDCLEGIGSVEDIDLFKWLYKSQTKLNIYAIEDRYINIMNK